MCIRDSFNVPSVLHVTTHFVGSSGMPPGRFAGSEQFRAEYAACRAASFAALTIGALGLVDVPVELSEALGDAAGVALALGVVPVEAVGAGEPVADAFGFAVTDVLGEGVG